uniref:Kringle domain-containing protein n=1 Tax=Branchiostoma floridae TaxID=7739 RepID=C3YRT3_BRAFL|eukprot:XP_002600826.1 hypothetical protein BRAFLDRAFT_75883 [Branchiostoma floridae]
MPTTKPFQIRMILHFSFKGQRLSGVRVRAAWRCESSATRNSSTGAAILGRKGSWDKSSGERSARALDALGFSALGAAILGHDKVRGKGCSSGVFALLRSQLQLQVQQFQVTRDAQYLCFQLGLRLSFWRRRRLIFCEHEMLARICLLFAIVCIISHGSSVKNGSCQSEKTTKTNMYMFVGRPHSSSLSYGNPNVMNVDKPVCKGEPDGSDYRGNVSLTRSGKTCQRWDVDFPHSLFYKPDYFPELVENYCRNPAGHEGTIWCYTTDPDTRWDYCIHPACPFVCMGSSTGSDYRGNVSVTISGKTCQRWGVNFPHEHTYLPEEYPELVENYCRNPDEGEPGPWCYTTDPNTRWEFCCNPA